MISVIICTYNPHPEFLIETVESIENQLYKDFELIIVDNNSTIPLSSLPFIKENNNIKVTIETKQGLTAARWAGVRAAKYEILVFVDDDNILDSSYLLNAERIVRENPNIGMLSGRILPRFEIAPKKWFSRYEGMIAIKRYSNLDGLYLIENNSNLHYTDIFPIGAGMIVKKTNMEDYYLIHLDNVSNYIEGRKGNELTSAEDIDYAFFCLSNNLKVGISTDLQLTHIIPEFRLSMPYLIKLSTSSLYSCYLVNKKWYSTFGKNVFKFFDMSALELYLRIAYYTIFKTKANLINKNYYRKVLELSK